MAPLLAAFVLLFALTAVVMRSGRGAKPTGDRPRGEGRSSALLGVAHASSMVSGALFPWLGVGRLPLGEAVAWSAVGVMVLAFALQVWSMRTLGPLFTTTLQASEAQPVVARGPYRVVRHPGYLAQLLFWFSFAVASRNAIVLAIVVVLDIVAYGNRIRTEERLLVGALGERYRAYAAGRARLVPGIW